LTAKEVTGGWPGSGARPSMRQWFAESFDFDELKPDDGRTTPPPAPVVFGSDSRGASPSRWTDRNGADPQQNMTTTFFGRRIETPDHLLQVPGGTPTLVAVRTAYSYNRRTISLTSQVDDLGRTTPIRIRHPPGDCAATVPGRT